MFEKQESTYKLAWYYHPEDQHQLIIFLHDVTSSLVSYVFNTSQKHSIRVLSERETWFHTQASQFISRDGHRTQMTIKRITILPP